MKPRLRKEIEMLKRDVEALEKKLDVKSDALYEQRKLIDFLCEHDKDDVVIDTDNTFCGFYYDFTMHNPIIISYLFGRNIKNVKLDTGRCKNVTVICNTKDKIVIEATKDIPAKVYKWYRIMKHNGEVADVTEYYQMYEVKI